MDIENIKDQIDFLQKQISELKEIVKDAEEAVAHITIFNGGGKNVMSFLPETAIDEDSCACISINSHGVDPKDESSAEWSTYNFVNLEDPEDLEELIENLEEVYVRWAAGDL